MKIEMPRGILPASKLYQTINCALSELDLRGEDEQVTRAMAIVTEAFLLHEAGREITVAALVEKAERVLTEEAREEE